MSLFNIKPNLGFDGDYAAIPSHMQRALLDYVNTGHEPGGFLLALLQNDLWNTVGRADSVNQPLIPLYLQWLSRSEVACYGSPEIVEKWIARGGLAGAK